MAQLQKYLLIIMLSQLMCTSLVQLAYDRGHYSNKINGRGVKAAYWPSYTVSFTPPSSINASLFTHTFYAFADLNDQTFQVELPATDKPIEFTPNF